MSLFVRLFFFYYLLKKFLTFISMDDKINNVVAKKQIEDNKKDKKSCWHEKRNVLIYNTLQKQQLTRSFEIEKKK